jgi:predicted dehydrogenase
MSRSPLRIGLIGAGANTRTKHLPGLQALPDVDIVAVCNRRAASTVAVAREFGIPHTYDRWEDLVADPSIDAVVIGTWPNLHCPVTLAALEVGKHVLTEARMARNAAEAHHMLAAAHTHRRLVTQVVPSPYGLKGHQVVVDLLKEGYLGHLREVYVQGLAANLADPAAPLSWRQDAALSGYNVLSLGILHETLMRWVPPPVRVLAQAHAFVPTRIDPESGARRPVGTPDSVQVLAVLENGARAVYQFSGVLPFGQSMGVWLYGSEGVLHYDFAADRLRGASRFHGRNSAGPADLQDIPIPPEKAGGWRVEEEFVAAIRDGEPVRFTDFATAVGYVEFTEAVARSAQRGEAVALPLELEDDESGS